MNFSVLKSLLAATLLMAGASTAQAQISFGPRVGLNATKLNLDLEDDYPLKSKLRYGAQVGLAMNAQFGNLAVQPAVLFTMKGHKGETKGSQTFSNPGLIMKVSFDESQKIQLNYIEVPVNLVYSTKGVEGGFQVFAGPYVALGVGGKVETETASTSTTTFNGQVIASESKSYSGKNSVEFVSKAGKAKDKEYFRNIDTGLNLGVGYKVGGMQAQLGYGLGLSNIVPNDQKDKKPEDKANNRGFQLALTYFFQE
jgi:hypothetical protein